MSKPALSHAQKEQKIRDQLTKTYAKLTRANESVAKITDKLVKGEQSGSPEDAKRELKEHQAHTEDAEFGMELLQDALSALKAKPDILQGTSSKLILAGALQAFTISILSAISSGA